MMSKQDPLDILANEIEQGFMQRGGWKSCRHLLSKQFNDMANRISTLVAIVEKLPKTADGVQFVPNTQQELWWHDGSGGFWRCFDVERDSQGRWWCDESKRLVSSCYSTRAAAKE